jgi:hypothetical protein
MRRPRKVLSIFDGMPARASTSRRLRAALSGSKNATV